MNQANTPENILGKTLELIKNNEYEKVFTLMSEFFLTNKKKSFSTTQEILLEHFIAICIKKHNLKAIKEGLNYFRSITPNHLDSFVKIILFAKDTLEDQLKNSKDRLDKLSESNDLESDEIPEIYLSYTNFTINVHNEGFEAQDFFSDGKDSDFQVFKKKEQILNLYKFTWETYKILLDFTKVNYRLLEHYYKILKAAFNFCQVNNRKNEFKRLCDSVRGYLQSLIKTERIKSSTIPNKVDLSRTDVIKNLINIRILLLDTAIELDQWQEAFKTGEDINYLIDKYLIALKQSDNKKKVPEQVLYEYSYNLLRVFKKAKYFLFHAYCQINNRFYLLKILKSINSLRKLGDEKSLRKAELINSKLDGRSITQANNEIILSTLATDCSSDFSEIYDFANFTKVGEKEYLEGKTERDREVENRFIKLLKLESTPSRKYLNQYINSSNLNPNSNEHSIIEDCHPLVRKLYNILESETNPISLAKKSLQLVRKLELLEDSTLKSSFAEYKDDIVKNIIRRTSFYLAKVYKNITLAKLKSIFQSESAEISFYMIEDILLDLSQRGHLRVEINHANDLIVFLNSKTLGSKLNLINNNVSQLLLDSKSLVALDNRNKLQKYKQAISKKLENECQGGLKIYDERASRIKAIVSQYEKQSMQKVKVIEIKRIKKQVEDEENKKKLERELIMERDEELARKENEELDKKFKLYLLDKIKEYSSIIHIDKAKLKVSDIQKDLTKVTSDELVQCLADEQSNNQIKKKKLFMKINKNIDYMIREYRLRDLTEYQKVIDQQKLIQKEENEKLLQRKQILDKSSTNSGLNLIGKFLENTVERAKSEKIDKLVNRLMQYFDDKLNNTKEQIVKIATKKFEEFNDEFKEDEEKKGVSYPDKDKIVMEKAIEKKGALAGDKEEPKTVNTSDAPTEFKKGVNVEKIAPKTVDLSAPKLDFQKGVNLDKEVKEEKKVEIDMPMFKRSKEPTNLNTEPEKKEEIKKLDFARSDKKTTEGTTPLPRTINEEAKTTDSKSGGFNKGKNVDPKKEEPAKPSFGFTKGANVEKLTDKPKEKDEGKWKDKKTDDSKKGFKRQEKK